MSLSFLQTLFIFILTVLKETYSLKNPLFLDVEFYPGTVNLRDGSDFFYVLVESNMNKTTDPLILWLNGGPGCSSLFGLVAENGPYRITNSNTFEKNPYSWNTVANVIYLDQPVGTGYSRTIKYVTSEEEIAQDLYTFFIKFLERYPQFIKREFYIAGESYAGQFIPAFGVQLLKQANPNINFKGISVGNGWVHPYDQYFSYGVYAKDRKLINDTQYEVIEKFFMRCQNLIKINATMSLIDSQYIWCEEETDSKVLSFITKPEVQQIFGVTGRGWQVCDERVYEQLQQLEYRSSTADIEQLLNANLKVFFYYGELDFICNYLGAEVWVDGLNWTHAKDFKILDYQNYTMNGQNIGYVKECHNFKFAVLSGSGHMVSKDTPDVSQYTIIQFLQA